MLKLKLIPIQSVEYATNEPVQPKYEVNAPDLYIPKMAYFSYVFVAGLALGAKVRFVIRP